MKAFCISLFLVMGINVFGSDWKTISVEQFQSEMKIISDKVEDTHSYSVEIGYTTLESSAGEVIHDQSTGYIKYSDKNYHSYAMGIQSIQNTRERVVVDSTNRIIAITNPVSEAIKNLSPELSTLLLKKASAIRKRIGNGMAEYQVDFGDQLIISSYLLKVDENNLMKQLDIRYAQKLKNSSGAEANLQLRMVFNNWKLNPALPESEFRADRYVKSENGIYVPTPQYEGYELSDERIKN